MKIVEVSYNYFEIKNRQGVKYDRFISEISELKNMVYLLCTDDVYVSVRCTKNTLKERLFQNTPKLFEDNDFKKSNKIIALLLDSDKGSGKLIEIKNSFASYYKLSCNDD